MSVFLNLGSLILGITSWIIPVIATKNHKNYGMKKYFKLSIVSFSSCLASLCLQLFEINNRVQLQDWSALMDTIGTLKWIVVILAVITILLNLIAFILFQEKETPML
jgi:cytochrome c oxidase subunit 4